MGWGCDRGDPSRTRPIVICSGDITSILCIGMFIKCRKETRVHEIAKGRDVIPLHLVSNFILNSKSIKYVFLKNSKYSQSVLWDGVMEGKHLKTSGHHWGEEPMPSHSQLDPLEPQPCLRSIPHRGRYHSPIFLKSLIIK